MITVFTDIFNLIKNNEFGFKCKLVTMRGRSVVVSVLGMELSGKWIALRNKRFPVRLRLLAMCRGELPAVIARLMSKCLWIRWKWQRRVKEITSSFPCCPVYCEYSWKKTQIEKKQQRPWLYPCKLNMPYQN